MTLVYIYYRDASIVTYASNIPIRKLKQPF